MSQVTSPDCENPYRSPQAEIPGTVDRRDSPDFFRCLFIGVAVAGLGTVACTVIILPAAFAVRRDTTFAALLLGSILVAVVTSIATKQYVVRRATCLRYCVAWGLRYLTIGAVLGILFGGFLYAAYIGSVIGTSFGSLGGAIQAWLLLRHDDTSQ